MPKKAIISLILFSLLLSFFPHFSAEPVEAATIISQPLNAKLTKEQTQSLFFSTLVYSNLHKFKKGTKMKDIKFKDNKNLKDFNKAWDIIQSNNYYPKMTVEDFIKSLDLGEWEIKDYNTEDILSVDASEKTKSFTTGLYTVLFYNKKKDNYIVAIRGTDDILDGLEDLATLNKWLPTSQKDKTLKFLQKNLIDVPVSKVTMVGHSLGGYLATTFSLLAGYKCYTFNAPGFSKTYYEAYVDFYFKFLFKDVLNERYKKIENFTIRRDTIGQFSQKVGTTKYYLKKDIIKEYSKPISQTGKDLEIPRNKISKGKFFSLHGVVNFFQYAYKPNLNYSKKVVVSNEKGISIFNGADKNCSVNNGCIYWKYGILEDQTEIKIAELNKKGKGMDRWSVDGWSVFIYKNKEAYVQTKYLKIEKPQASYMRDIKKIYTFNQLDEGVMLPNVLKYVGKSKGYNIWDGTNYSEREKETTKGFDNINTTLPFPIKKGKKWTYNELNYIIKSVNETLKTPAGTFKNVVEVRMSYSNKQPYIDYETAYFAQGNGLILHTFKPYSEKSIKYKELIKIKKK